jgi:hypothetical protein
MDSTFVRCTIGLATCGRSKQKGLAFEHSFVEEKMSGEFAHTHSVSVCVEIDGLLGYHVALSDTTVNWYKTYLWEMGSQWC